MEKINTELIAAMLATTLMFNACTRDNSSDGYSSSSKEVDWFNCSSDSGNGREIEYGSFEYEGQTYRTVVIGTQTWMANGLNYNIAGSGCYGDYQCVHPSACPACYAVGGMCYGYSGSYYTTITNAEAQANCDRYGRLYDWVTAMALDASCKTSNCSDKISAKHKGICPSGWHIPTQAEWNTLSSYVENDQGCSICAAKHLKANCGWSSSGNGFDTYGFAALPGGGGFGSVGSIGYYGYWWSATERDDSTAYLNFMFYGSYAVHQDNFYKFYRFNVRCIMD